MESRRICKIKTSAGNKAKNFIIEEWHDGFSWYRKYANGWIEQGGRKETAHNGYGTIMNVALHVPMKDTNYQVLTDSTSGPVGQSYCNLWHVIYNGNRTTFFQVESCTHFQWVYWRVEGFYK